MVGGACTSLYIINTRASSSCCSNQHLIPYMKSFKDALQAAIMDKSGMSCLFWMSMSTCEIEDYADAAFDRIPPEIWGEIFLLAVAVDSFDVVRRDGGP